MRLVLVLLTLMVVLVPTGVPSEASRGRATPVSTPAAVCAREPRTIDGLVAIAGLRENPVIINTLEELPDALPSGTPVDSETASEIRAMLDEFAACILSGDLLRSYAYFSNRFIRDAGPLAEGFVTTLAAAPSPEPDQTFYSIDDVSRIERLDDGRVGAVVTYGGGCERSQPLPTCISYVVFVEEQGRWSFDAEIHDLKAPDGNDVLSVAEYLGRQGTPVATPTT